MDISHTFASVLQHCPNCEFKRRWVTQPMIANIPEGNLLLSASVLFSGSSSAKTNCILSFMKINSISQSTFYHHSQNLLQPTILSLWNDTQKQLLDWLSKRPGEVIVSGDMRADSPGHCAKYGSYTVMKLVSNRVIHISLVKVRTFTFNARQSNSRNV